MMPTANPQLVEQIERGLTGWGEGRLTLRR